MKRPVELLLQVANKTYSNTDLCSHTTGPNGGAEKHAENKSRRLSKTSKHSRHSRQWEEGRERVENNRGVSQERGRGSQPT